MMILKIEFAKKISVGVSFGLLRRFPLLRLIQQENIIKTLISSDFTISPLLGFWPIFLYTVLTSGSKPYVMQQYLTYLCTDINETGPSLVIFPRVDQSFVLRFLFCRVYIRTDHRHKIYCTHKNECCSNYGQLPKHGVQRRKISVNCFVFLRVFLLALLLLYVT